MRTSCGIMERADWRRGDVAASWMTATKMTPAASRQCSGKASAPATAASPTTANAHNIHNARSSHSHHHNINSTPHTDSINYSIINPRASCSAAANRRRRKNGGASDGRGSGLEKPAIATPTALESSQQHHRISCNHITSKAIEAAKTCSTCNKRRQQRQGWR